MIYFSVWSRSTYSNVPSRVWGGERGEGLTETSTISGQTTEGTPWKVVAADAKTGLGQLEDAQWEIEQLLINRSEFSIASLIDSLPYEDPQRTEAFVQDVRKAGLPES